MTPDELKAAARRCLYAKQTVEAGHVLNPFAVAGVVHDAAALATAYTELRAAAKDAMIFASAVRYVLTGDDHTGAYTDAGLLRDRLAKLLGETCDAG